jgi:hypothetical protein
MSEYCEEAVERAYAVIRRCRDAEPAKGRKRLTSS